MWKIKKSENSIPIRIVGKDIKSLDRQVKPRLKTCAYTKTDSLPFNVIKNSFPIYFAISLLLMLSKHKYSSKYRTKNFHISLICHMT